MWAVTVPPNTFSPMFLLSQRWCADACCHGTEMLLTDWPCHFEWKAGFTWSFKKLWIISCTDGSLFCQKIGKNDDLTDRTMATIFLVEGVVFAMFSTAVWTSLNDLLPSCTWVLECFITKRCSEFHQNLSSWRDNLFNYH